MYVIEVLISIKSTRTKPLHGNQYVKTLNGIAFNIVFLHILRNSERFYCMETEGTCTFAMYTFIKRMAIQTSKALSVEPILFPYATGF